MSELTQTYLNRLVTDYGAAAARAARAPRNTSAARYAFEVENAACASLLAAIGSLVADREKLAAWQPIETVPKDGTTVLVWFGPRVGVWAVEWSEALGWCVNDNKHDPVPLRGWGYGDGREPTHWREMPAGPK